MSRGRSHTGRDKIGSMIDDAGGVADKVALSDFVIGNNNIA